MPEPSILTQPIATLVGTIVGLGAIAYQTSRGFANLIAAQDHRAKIEAEARQHADGLARAAKKADEEQRGRQVAAALHGEIDGLTQQFDGIANSFASMREKNEAQKAGGLPFIKQSVKVSHKYYPIFDAYISDLGLLGPSIARDVSSFYAKCSHELEYNEINSRDLLSELLDGIAIFHAELTTESRDLAVRLRAFYSGMPDQGPIQFGYDFKGIFNRGE
ncbi:hypothetical protein [Methylobacterium sp. J-077]|uniref:hypothetical protein n=1 Tax=Methylobacterium sp. J-077 TaxID=2836656 RepID=UPI001FBBF15A|nr:hypothetical protein [Methylobacterium sp. J-077]MCJ2125102.1 hypothetical protein [Methylobacterium sp. J-077]